MRSRNAECKIHNEKKRNAERSRVVTVAFVILHLAFLAACETEAEKPPSTPPAVNIGMENVVTVGRGVIVVGPIVSGELRAYDGQGRFLGMVQGAGVGRVRPIRLFVDVAGDAR